MKTHPRRIPALSLLFFIAFPVLAAHPLLADDPAGAPPSGKGSSARPAPEKAAPVDPIAGAREMALLYKSGRYEECAALARRVVEADPAGYFAPYYLTACASRSKDEKRGLEWLERLLETDYPKPERLLQDPELSWLVARPGAGEPFKRREERIAARWQGVLRHQRFSFRLPVWDNAEKLVESRSFRGDVVAVLIVEKAAEESSQLAALALEALRDELSSKGFSTVALHLEPAPRPDFRVFEVERFRKHSSFRGQSLLVEARDLHPLKPTVFPAVVFLDRTGVPRFIEEGYRDSQPSKYRARVAELLQEPPPPAAEARPAAK
jgi:hypothetical protein